MPSDLKTMLRKTHGQSVVAIVKTKSRPTSYGLMDRVPSRICSGIGFGLALGVGHGGEIWGDVVGMSLSYLVDSHTVPEHW